MRLRMEMQKKGLLSKMAPEELDNMELGELREKLGVASDCGKCGKLARTIVKEYAKSAAFVSAV